jgi:hypothetical protein
MEESNEHPLVSSRIPYEYATHIRTLYIYLITPRRFLVELAGLFLCHAMAAMRFPLLVALLFAPARALDNGLGLTPPLGYNAYDHVGCCDCSAQTKLSVGTHSPTLFTHRRRSVGRRVGSAGANETTMKEQGQALIDTGMHKLGFVYVNSDCGWMGGRHPNGTLFENPTKFRASLPT